MQLIWSLCSVQQKREVKVIMCKSSKTVGRKTQQLADANAHLAALKEEQAVKKRVVEVPVQFSERNGVSGRVVTK